MLETTKGCWVICPQGRIVCKVVNTCDSKCVFLALSFEETGIICWWLGSSSSCVSLGETVLPVVLSGLSDVPELAQLNAQQGGTLGDNMC
jgi:hypothetical protein